MNLRWSPTKNAELRERYGIGFERVVAALEAGDVLDNRRHPNIENYGHQRQLIVRIDDYIWVVPAVDDEDATFLKTMFPSRKATKKYLER